MISIARDVPLAPYTTLRIGGPAHCLAEVRTESDLLEALVFAESESLPVFILGGGSNLLVPDSGFPGLVIHLAITGEIEFQDNQVTVPAGTDWDHLVNRLCRQGMSGMECLAGIPGLTGAAPIQNIGAYGQEVAQTIQTVRAYDRRSRQFTTISNEDCRFAYRQSIFNTTHRNCYIITGVTFALDPRATPNLTYPDLRTHFERTTDAPSPFEVYEAVRAIRRSKGMLLVPDDAEGVEDTRSAGSFFKNPIVPCSVLAHLASALGTSEETIPRHPAADGKLKVPAAWLLDQAGFHRSYTNGQAGISSRHTLALINRGQATYADVTRLRDLIVRTVEGRFQITLEQEPVEPGTTG